MDDLDDLDLIDNVDPAPEDRDFEPESACYWCGATFAGNQVGHCTGGKFRRDYPDGSYSGCCQNFASLHAFDRHRTGPYDGNRRCLTVTEMQEKGWQRTGPYNSWRTPPPKNSPWKKDA